MPILEKRISDSDKEESAPFEPDSMGMSLLFFSVKFTLFFFLSFFLFFFFFFFFFCVLSICLSPCLQRLLRGQESQQA